MFQSRDWVDVGSDVIVGGESGANASFNPATGLMLVRTTQRKRMRYLWDCFNPATGLMLVRTTDRATWDLRSKCFNPATGLMLVRTTALAIV